MNVWIKHATTDSFCNNFLYYLNPYIKDIWRLYICEGWTSKAAVVIMVEHFSYQ